MTTLDDYEDGPETRHLKNRFRITVGWNPDALTWVAIAVVNGETIHTEGATADRAVAAMTGRVEAADVEA